MVVFGFILVLGTRVLLLHLFGLEGMTTAV